MDREALFDYAKTQFQIEPDYPWRTHPHHAVLRHPKTRKWFALIMNLSADKLGHSSRQERDVMNVKCDPFLREALLEKEGFYPAYHMNKKHWISVDLSGLVDENDIYFLLQTSFGLTQ